MPPDDSATAAFLPDYLSEAFGLKPSIPAYLDPMYSIQDFATGVCFASAGSGYDNATADVLLTFLFKWSPVVAAIVDIAGSDPSVGKSLRTTRTIKDQLETFLGAEQEKEIITEALYIMSVGTNDFLENYYAIPGRRSQFTIQQYQDFLIGLAEDFVKQLYALGARKLSLTGLPPMGCLPLERATNFMHPDSCAEEYNDLALEFNGKLKQLVAELNDELPGMKVVFANPYDLLLQLITAPSLYGFENAEVGCCGSGTFEMGIMCTPDHPLTCTDADKYVFWDAFHLTDRANQIISSYLFKDLKSNFL
ncbi:hypothetical protein OIU76_001661 [Salix suchowensis]|nr:hypothetical protein OIU76_001661 [Salix suchowensis]